jgi:16S rRNA (uracil1498-N3)-methyltransferase
MKFLYRADAGSVSIVLEGDDHRYVSRVRRFRVGDIVPSRNMADDTLYLYSIDSSGRRETHLTLVESRYEKITARRKLHLGWCIIEPKQIEKVLPTLNETGVEKITFIRCDRSQKNFTPDMRRLEKILINSSQQCGRSTLMRLGICDSLEEFFSSYPESAVVDFSDTPLSCGDGIETIVVGCEGGFSSDERELFSQRDIYGFDTSSILRSESAVVAVASRLLL